MSKEHEPTTSQQFELEDDDVLMESTTRTRYCACFPCFRSRPRAVRYGSTSSASVWEKLQQTAQTEKKWWAGPIKRVKKIREWSEIIAGPRWKTFLRRFNKNGKNPAPAKFRYDPMSYARNFDEGQGQNSHLDEEDDYSFPDFSSRFASLPSSCKSSMDLGDTVIPS